MSGLEKGSMRLFFNNIYTKLREDEELMRLLHYKPADYMEKRPDPLDKSLPDIVDENSQEYWKIVEKTIKRSVKTSEIQEKGICRLYIYGGRRRSRFGNYLIADQEVVIDIFVHELFEKDARMDWIRDRINKLLVLERIVGIGMLEFAAGNSRVAPIGYEKYELIYKFTASKK